MDRGVQGQAVAVDGVAAVGLEEEVEGGAEAGVGAVDICGVLAGTSPRPRTADNPWGRIQVRNNQSTTDTDGVDTLTVEAEVDGVETTLVGTGNGPISAFFHALQGIGIDARLLDYTEHTMSEGASAQAASYIECAIGDKVLWGIGIDANTTRASLKAVVSAVNRAAR
ncbi:2-isopropylmalate synthase [Streptomyces aurantiogriseus]